MGQKRPYSMKVCEDCERELPSDKFNPESGSPNSCFRCRIQGVRLGFRQGKEMFHGDSLVGGTIASDNRHTVSEARKQGHDPVPVSTGVSHGLTGNKWIV